MKTAKWTERLVAMLAVAVAVGLASAGCQFDRTGEQRPSDSWTLNDAGGDDVAPDGPLPTRFELVNEKRDGIEVEQSQCTTGSPIWLTLGKGDGSFQISSCGTCQCGVDYDGGSGPVVPCGSCGRCPRQMKAVGSGEKVGWTWDGTAVDIKTKEGGGQCHESYIPEPGDEITAQFCWLEGDSATASNRTCRTVEFPYGKETVKVVVEQDDEPPKPTPTSFVLENDSKQQVRLYPNTPCIDRSAGPPWVATSDGKDPVKMTTSCGECTCDEAADGGCGACPAVCSKPDQKFLQTGGSVKWTWAGRRFLEKQKGSTACYEPTVPKKGTELTATFCWWEVKLTTDATPPERHCDDVTFSYGEEETVTLAIDEMEQDEGPTETTFELQNELGSDMWIQATEGCGAGWLDFQSSEVRTPSERCSTCSCEMLEQEGTCPVCGACAPPQVERLPSGESVRMTWSGLTFKTDQVDERLCYRKQVPPQGREFAVDFCWSTTSQPTGSEELTDVTCRTKRFRYGQEKVVHVVKRD